MHKTWWLNKRVTSVLVMPRVTEPMDAPSRMTIFGDVLRMLMSTLTGAAAERRSRKTSFTWKYVPCSGKLRLQAHKAVTKKMHLIEGEGGEEGGTALEKITSCSPFSFVMLVFAFSMMISSLSCSSLDGEVL